MRQQKNYLIRLWNDSQDQQMWRATIMDIKTRKKAHFANLKDLKSYIDNELKHTNSKVKEARNRA